MDGDSAEGVGPHEVAKSVADALTRRAASTPKISSAYSFLARRDIERDAADIAAEHGGSVVDYGNGEWVVNSAGGEEIARWEIL